jgi:hypothetical protein
MTKTKKLIHSGTDYDFSDPNVELYSPALTSELIQEQYFIPNQSEENVKLANHLDPELEEITAKKSTIIQNYSKRIIALSIVLIVVAIYAIYDFYTELSSTADIDAEYTATSSSTVPNNYTDEDDDLSQYTENYHEYNTYKEKYFQTMIEDIKVANVDETERGAIKSELYKIYYGYRAGEITENEADEKAHDLIDKYPEIFISNVK